MKRKHFLTQKEIGQIVKCYGGFRKYQYHDKLTCEYNRLTLCQKTSFNMWLCIDKDNNGLTIVTLTDANGLIVQKDYWNKRNIVSSM